MKQKTLAIPIRLTDYSNSSQVVSLLTPDVGALDGLAKGAYRLKGSFQSPFDLVILYEVVYLERSSSGLSILTEASVIDGYRGLRKSWERYIGATHVLEFLRAVVTHGEEASELFDLVVSTFRSLCRADAPGQIESLLLGFDLRALCLLGLLPPVSACVRCGRPWPPSNREVFLSAQEGGLVCRVCREKQRVARGVHVAGAVVRVLKALAEAELGGEADQDREWQAIEPDWRRHRRFLTGTVKEMRTRLLERELTVLESAGVPFGVTNS